MLDSWDVIIAGHCDNPFGYTRTGSPIRLLSTENHTQHDANFVATSGTVGCRHDDQRGYQWPQSWHHYDFVQEARCNQIILYKYLFDRTFYALWIYQ